ncbi:MAG TPA: tetratricopeptide repeat protein [Nitrospirae bacterium]|nr:tetratricopeptide repeat protein [bacterium BMS3Abin10]GBE37958.1 tetratricopeptide repeat protein [bacterium BMS3Bbin08]HDH50291.1 tetratricopeptide repeat protein [Nitrospirota bacterium]HDK81289.1 tetratricopeptide repeat protein [Nitrospirota bacterium]HDO25964.1 tetratricopeptide repeat protein [Nitrospirota bacterium]
MKVSARILLTTLLIVLFAMSTYAQETLSNELNAKAATLYQQGRYSEAVNVVKEALKVAENTFGPDHPNVATSLNNLAGLYKEIGKKDKAKKFEERAKRIHSGK